MSNRLKNLADAGVSIWLDDLSRDRLDSGNLADLVATRSVTGVTTNPTIFAAALGTGSAYDAQVGELAAQGAPCTTTIRVLTTDDVRNACDVMAETFRATGGVDGRVSIEVSPLLAMDTDATIAEAVDLSKTVDRPNVLIKIPATEPGLAAITATIANGISVNVTLIFALERYRAVIGAYLDGLEQAAANGHDLSSIHSVASFFVSRVDSEVDQRLDAIGSDEADRLEGKGGHRQRPTGLRALPANVQRRPAGRRSPRRVRTSSVPCGRRPGSRIRRFRTPSTSTELVVADTVNTMPEKTLNAFADHGEVHGDTVTGFATDAQEVIDGLKPSASPTTRWSRPWNQKGSRNSRCPGPSWRTPSAPNSTRPPHADQPDSAARSRTAGRRAGPSRGKRRAGRAATGSTTPPRTGRVRGTRKEIKRS